MTARFTEQIQRAARLIASARHVVALTGAGISTPSGIPDFRSPGTGEWARLDPMEVVSLTAFYRQPERFYRWLRPLVQKMAAAEPNPAHHALAELEKLGRLQALLTQNIDGLHQKAGSKNVVELHGSLERLLCLNCRNTFPSKNFYPHFIANNVIPRCPACAAVLKPEIVFYEETLKPSTWDAAVKEAARADVMIIAGTSLEVWPVNSLPLYALENGAHLIINTLSRTHLDNQADILLNYEISDALPSIVRAILEG
jgi:NAD-dependent deacetylase